MTKVALESDDRGKQISKGQRKQYKRTRQETHTTEKSVDKNESKNQCNKQKMWHEFSVEFNQLTKRV